MRRQPHIGTISILILGFLCHIQRVAIDKDVVIIAPVQRRRTGIAAVVETSKKLDYHFQQSKRKSGLIVMIYIFIRCGRKQAGRESGTVSRVEQALTWFSPAS